MTSVRLEVEPKKRRRRFYAVILAVVLLAVVLAYLAFAPTCPGPGPVEIEVTTDKPFYLQGEEIRFSIYINNQQDWPVPYPSTVIYHILDSSHYHYSYPPPPPGVSSIPPHHRTFYYTYVWDQKVEVGGNRTQVQPGNYTIMVSFEGSVNYGDGTNCTIEIRPNPPS